MAALLLALVLLSTGRFLLAQPPANSPQRDLEVLRRLEEEYLRAEIEDDSAIAGTILADDYVGLKPDGSSATKADVLSRLDRHERRREPYMITATNMRQHLFGDTACVTYTKVYTKPGTQAAFGENVLHVLIRRNGIWRLQVSSPLPSPKP
ncbi:MAG: nuclear transport factor 2 family protein [Acidobacteriaceae bacterium]